MAAGDMYHKAFADHEHPYLSYGLLYPKAAARHVDHTFHAEKVYILASGSLSKNTDAVTQLEDALRGKVVGVRRGMTPHTLWSECIAVARQVKELDADLLLTIGGGSLIDAAKIIALAVANDAFDFTKLEHLTNNRDASVKRPDLAPPRIPIISIPTSLSGGEYSDHAGGTNDQTRHKHGFGPSPPLGPRLIILSPQLAMTTPPRFWLSTGIRAVDHCVETICSPYSTPASDAAAAEALHKLVPGLLRSALDADNTDLDARFQCQLGVRDAMQAVKGKAPLGASHGIGHQLGPLGVGHGETSCILLPAVCAFNARHAADAANEAHAKDILVKQKRVLDTLWAEPNVATALASRGLGKEKADLSACLGAFISELRMPRSLGALGVGRDKFDELASSSLKDRWCQTNAVPLRQKAQVMEILDMCA
ncbi:Aldehyde-alcohol dehydrogenase 2 [Lasiodiplodia hormozganensis]|uniref:Aldehyde-alcohol dehydrogenase 2 n=1 Tax=Lasiodiplodia hormozganensis TaxID=869390 RepID=A0AA39YV79_9PEZI|nr:Aldehyde-alcohol dehydrogenase 2 [Lasiodiplodia hormozganensis]